MVNETMKKNFCALLYCFVFTLVATPLWTACSVEDVPVPEEEEPGMYYQWSDTQPLVGTLWYCIDFENTLGHFGSVDIPLDSYVYLSDIGKVLSNMSIFPQGTTYEIDNGIFITTPTRAYKMVIEYVDRDKMEWTTWLSQTELITLHLSTSSVSQQQGETNNGGGTIVPVEGDTTEVVSEGQ